MAFSRNESGQAFLAVMLILTAMVILGTASVALASGLKRMSMMQESRTRAYYAADAGVERALARLAGDSEWRDPAGGQLAGPYLSSDGEPAGTIVLVRVADAAGQPGFGRRVQITATGTFREAEQQITATAILVPNTGLFNGVSILRDKPGRRVVVSGDLDIRGPGGRGTLIIDGDLAVEGGAGVFADVYVSGLVEPGGKTRIQGRVEERYPGIPRFPTVDEQWLRTHATGLFPGDLNIGDPGQGGLDISTLAGHDIYFVDGTITIAGTYHARTTLVAAEDIEITGDLNRATSDTGLLTLIALGGRGDTRGDITVRAQNAVVEALILAQGTFGATGDVNLRGGVVARDLAAPGWEAPLAPAVRINCDTTLVAPNAPTRDIVRTRPRIESWLGG